MKKKLVTALTAFALAFILSGCGAPVKGNTYTFTVLGVESSYSFGKDGSVEFTSPLSTIEGKWTYEKGEVTISWNTGSEETLYYNKDTKSLKDYSGIEFYPKAKD